MKAISYQGPRKMSVSTHAKPKIKSPTDALLRVTTSGICGSDLHMYDGRTPLGKGTVVGHEIMGVIDEAGDAVQSIQKGDRVVLPFNIACGFCFNCHPPTCPFPCLHRVSTGSSCTARMPRRFSCWCNRCRAINGEMVIEIAKRMGSDPSVLWAQESEPLIEAHPWQTPPPRA